MSVGRRFFRISSENNGNVTENDTQKNIGAIPLCDECNNPCNEESIDRIRIIVNGERHYFCSILCVNTSGIMKAERFIKRIVYEEETDGKNTKFYVKADTNKYSGDDEDYDN